MTRILFRWQLVLGALLAMTLSLVAPTAANAEPADLTSAIRAVEPATVRIDTTIEYQGAIGSGTGFVIDPNGAVVTNYHVVAGADTITATVAGRSFTADLVGYDRTRDIAVLQLRGAGGLPTAAIGDSSALREGEPVVALGNARGSGGPLTNEAGTITGFGRSISAKDELTGSFEQMTGLIEFAAPVRAGDSGGPVVDSSGRVVGVTTAATVNFRMGPGGAGFAIPINDALATAGQIRAGVRSDSIHIGRPTLLGVGVSTGDQDPSVNGVIVREVIPGGPAQAAGLQNGDVLISLDGAPVDSATTLTNVLDRHYPGDVVDLVWIDRAGQQINGKATLTS
ncbi:trypsin [Mycolicibacterium arabiense]|uniref:Trypsin n=1 Tax=Mycolicibacterium arabiense TaxID=1286181 RepID=A0A7I7S3V1_9MYCO|nr:trypsin-like peptidase domain-containing protein [Mycolicibacterium arabiense]MBJ7383041.1 trypsin-like peptidase domain-containing protein [Mycolicibacterium sp.]MCV7374763.1 trypsin-like peptidase domain-containing protein [Mycolicibacterium arabiense]BBY51081.1 trypsin [Mycolicibacterium arabiense]